MSMEETAELGKLHAFFSYLEIAKQPWDSEKVDQLENMRECLHVINVNRMTEVSHFLEHFKGPESNLSQISLTKTNLKNR